LTGLTRVQWWPTGQRWKRHQPRRIDFSEASGTQIVAAHLVAAPAQDHGPREAGGDGGDQRPMAALATVLHRG
jgi:hypothetical protein